MNGRNPRRGHWHALWLGSLALATATGCLSSAASRNVTVWIVGGDEELASDSAASPENEVFSASRREVRLRAALNETIAFQIGLRTTTPPAGPFDVHVSDLAGGADTLPAGSVVAVYRVRYTRVDRFRSWYPDHTGRPATPALFPDVLVPWDAPHGGGPMILSEDRNEFVWIELRVPPTVAAGE